MNKGFAGILITLMLTLALPWACFAGGQAIPRPEHPFPQMSRAEWTNLNGEWEFAETDDTADESFLTEKAYPDKIIVPFCRESRLSGLGRKGFIKNVWYRRAFEMPGNWKSPRTILHIGACDYKTRVWVNGKYIGEHLGGNSPISLEITRQLVPGKNTLIIHAYDDTRSGLQGTGKQSHQEESNGCVYTRTTGIWQTVWLEGVGECYIKDCKIEPDPAGSRALLQVETNGLCGNAVIKAVAYAGNKVVGTASAPADWRNTHLVLNLSEKHLWSLQNPYLYTLKLIVLRSGKAMDSVDSYFGLRSVSIQGAAILINGKAVFQRTVLDQGFYPDGIWTAPSDKALKADVEMSMAAGFNGARLHQKVFEPRFIYWADKLGYLLWGEYPNWGMSYENSQAAMPMIEEWTQIVRRDRNHPSIIGWCPFNETGRSAGMLQNTVANITRAVDPTRPVIDVSGYVHSLPDAEVLDNHDYDQNPSSFGSRYANLLGSDSATPARYIGTMTVNNVPFFVSEYGGIGWTTDGAGWGYGVGPKSAEEFYKRYKGLADAQLDNRHVFGFCYTQLYDVEQERNGIYTYDRKSKFDINRIRVINSRTAAYEKNPPIQVVTDAAPADWNVLIGAAIDGDKCREWRYTTSAPVEDWMKPGFSDSSWQTGRGGFGTKVGWEERTHTPWNTENIWMRQEFDYDGSQYNDAILVAHYDNETEVYVNGSEIWSGVGWNDNYGSFDITAALRNALKPGKNTIAVHCHQDTGGQFIDVALLLRSKAK